MITPILPTIEELLATILSEPEAARYAPDAPESLIHDTTGFLQSLTSSMISSLATGVPPGLFISRRIALTDLSDSAVLICSLISSGLTTLPPNILDEPYPIWP